MGLLPGIDVKVPEVHLPSMPEVRLPSVPKVSVPTVAMPEIKIPSVRVPNAEGVWVACRERMFGEEMVRAVDFALREADASGRHAAMLLLAASPLVFNATLWFAVRRSVHAQDRRATGPPRSAEEVFTRSTSIPAALALPGINVLTVAVLCTLRGRYCFAHVVPAVGAASAASLAVKAAVWQLCRLAAPSTLASYALYAAAGVEALLLVATAGPMCAAACGRWPYDDSDDVD